MAVLGYSSRSPELLPWVAQVTPLRCSPGLLSWVALPDCSPELLSWVPRLGVVSSLFSVSLRSHLLLLQRGNISHAHTYKNLLRIYFHYKCSPRPFSLSFGRTRHCNHPRRCKQSTRAWQLVAVRLRALPANDGVHWLIVGPPVRDVLA